MCIATREAKVGVDRKWARRERFGYCVWYVLRCCCGGGGGGKDHINVRIPFAWIMCAVRVSFG